MKMEDHRQIVITDDGTVYLNLEEHNLMSFHLRQKKSNNHKLEFCDLKTQDHNTPEGYKIIALICQEKGFYIIAYSTSSGKISISLAYKANQYKIENQHRMIDYPNPSIKISCQGKFLYLFNTEGNLSKYNYEECRLEEIQQRCTDLFIADEKIFMFNIVEKEGNKLEQQITVHSDQQYHDDYSFSKFSLSSAIVESTQVPAQFQFLEHLENWIILANHNQLHILCNDSIEQLQKLELDSPIYAIYTHTQNRTRTPGIICITKDSKVIKFKLDEKSEQFV